MGRDHLLIIFPAAKAFVKRNCTFDAVLIQQLLLRTNFFSGHGEVDPSTFGTLDFICHHDNATFTIQQMIVMRAMQQAPRKMWFSDACCFVIKRAELGGSFMFIVIVNKKNSAVINMIAPNSSIFVTR